MKNKEQKRFLPQLITNDPIPEDAPFPRYLTVKRHGICIIIHPEYDVILGRSLKVIKNKQFQERFKPLLDYVKEQNVIIQGEAHMNGVVSDDMVHFLNTIDLTKQSKTSLKHIQKNILKGKFILPEEKYLSFPEEIKIYVFDYLDLDNLEKTYLERISDAEHLKFSKTRELIEILKPISITNREEEDEYYNMAMQGGFEGLVIRYDKPYKFGRTSPKELIAYKRIPVPTFDGKIIGINQATIVDPDAEKKTNELGYSVTSKKKDDRIPIEQAKDFQVEFIPEGKTEPVNFGVSMAGFNHEERKEVWKNQQDYIGRMIEFKCKEYKGIDKPKSAVFIRFRDDKMEADLHMGHIELPHHE